MLQATLLTRGISQHVSMRWGFLGVELRSLTEGGLFVDDRCDTYAHVSKE